MPEFAVDPGDAGNETVGLDGTKDCPGFGINLMDFPVAVLPDPQCAFGPCETRVTAGRRWDRGEYAAGRRIDFVDLIFGDLEQMLVVEGGTGVPGESNRVRGLAAGGVDCVQLVAGCEPDMPAVERYAVHAGDTVEGSVFLNYFCRRFFTSLIRLIVNMEINGSRTSSL